MERHGSSHCMHPTIEEPNASDIHDPQGQFGNDNKKRSVIRFEELSIEIFFNIFDCLDSYHVFEAFSNLNKHFEDLLTSEHFSLKLTIPFMSKSIVKNRFKYIAPHIHRVVSLHLSQPFFIEKFFKLFPIDSSFTRLQILTLNCIKPTHIVPILTGLISFHRLFSLTIICRDRVEDQHVIQSLIFRLPVLKFVKLFFGYADDIHPLTFGTSGEQRNYTLEHFVINTQQSPASLYRYLSHMPRLRRLSADSITSSQNLPIEQLMLPINLTHLSMSRLFISFDEFKSFISNIGSQLQSLRISIRDSNEYLNAGRWERLISDQMPRLIKFVFNYCGPTVIDNSGNLACRLIADQFSSSFWTERKWFFAHRHRQMHNQECLAFYSLQTHWRKYFRSEEVVDNNMCSYQDTVFNQVREVYMNTRDVIANSSLTFPSATQLILFGDDIIDVDRFIDNLGHIIPFTQIIDLEITYHDYYFPILIKFLTHMPNIRSLALDGIPEDETNVLPKQEVDVVGVVCDNKVTDVTIIDVITLANVQLFINLFPQMKSLQIVEPKDDLPSIIRNLLSNRTADSHLFELMFQGDHKMVEQVKTMIDREKLLDDYTIEHENIPMILDNLGITLWW